MVRPGFLLNLDPLNIAPVSLETFAEAVHHTSPAAAMHSVDTTSGVFELTEPAMNPTRMLAGTWARFITLLEMPIAELDRKLADDDKTFVWLKRQVDEPLWNESYYMDFVSHDADVGGYVRIGRYPNLGPEVLVANNITLIDSAGDEVFKKIKDGAKIRLHNGGVYAGDRRLVNGVERSDEEIADLMHDAKTGLVAHLEAFAGNTIEFIRSESPLLIDGMGIPDIDVDVVYRFIRDTTWVSVRWYQPGGPLTAEEVAAIRAWIAAGAAWPEGLVLKDRSLADANWWSLKPLSRPPVPTPPAAAAFPIRNPIEFFQVAVLRLPVLLAAQLGGLSALTIRV